MDRTTAYMIKLFPGLLFSHVICFVHHSYLQQKIQLKESFPIVICHPSGGFNLAFRMSRNGFTRVHKNHKPTSFFNIINVVVLNLIMYLFWIFFPIQLQDEAAMTLKCLEKCRDSGFEEVFMTKIDDAVKYDYCMR